MRMYEKSISLCAPPRTAIYRGLSRTLAVIISESSQAPGWLNTFFCAAAISHFRSATMHHTIALVLPPQDGDWNFILFTFQTQFCNNRSSCEAFHLKIEPLINSHQPWNHNNLYSCNVRTCDDTHHRSNPYYLLSDRAGSVATVLMKKLHEGGRGKEGSQVGVTRNPLRCRQSRCLRLTSPPFQSPRILNKLGPGPFCFHNLLWTAIH